MESRSKLQFLECYNASVIDKGKTFNYIIVLSYYETSGLENDNNEIFIAGAEVTNVLKFIQQPLCTIHL